MHYTVYSAKRGLAIAMHGVRPSVRRVFENAYFTFISDLKKHD